ncbi:MAG: ATPase associated with various cellular activity [Microgenomates group bacterium GW2011_GWC1_43_13]|nr:MAG: ATPase associated with various cellular activity [Microgenomates group bacterium GW2011_GWC1_43_13]
MDPTQNPVNPTVPVADSNVGVPTPPAPVTTPPVEPVEVPEEPTMTPIPEPQQAPEEQPVAPPVVPAEGTGDAGTGMPPVLPGLQLPFIPPEAQPLP